MWTSDIVEYCRQYCSNIASNGYVSIDIEMLFILDEDAILVYRGLLVVYSSAEREHGFTDFGGRRRLLAVYQSTSVNGRRRTALRLIGGIFLTLTTSCAVT